MERDFDKHPDGTYIRIQAGDPVVIVGSQPLSWAPGGPDLRGRVGTASQTRGGGRTVRFVPQSPDTALAHWGSAWWLRRSDVRRVRSGKAKPLPYEALPRAAGTCRAVGDL